MGKLFTYIQYEINSLADTNPCVISQGAQIEHSQLCTHLKTWGDTVGIDRTCRVFQFGAHVFDSVIDEVFLPLMIGVTICIPSDDDRMK